MEKYVCHERQVSCQEEGTVSSASYSVSAHLTWDKDKDVQSNMCPTTWPALAGGRQEAGGPFTLTGHKFKVMVRQNRMC